MVGGGGKKDNGSELESLEEEAVEPDRSRCCEQQKSWCVRRAEGKPGVVEEESESSSSSESESDESDVFSKSSSWS